MSEDAMRAVAGGADIGWSEAIEVAAKIAEGCATKFEGTSLLEGPAILHQLAASLRSIKDLRAEFAEPAPSPTKETAI